MWSPVHVLLSGETIDFQPSSEWLWFKVILFLIVLSVIAFLIKRFNRTGEQLIGNRNAGRIRVTETCSLGNRNFLIVAQCDEERHILGVGPNFCQYLTKLSTTINGKENNISLSDEEGKSDE